MSYLLRIKIFCLISFIKKLFSFNEINRLLHDFKIIAHSYRKSIIIFGAMNGNMYGDNSRHLYEWVLKSRPHVLPIWLTKSDKVFEKLKLEGKPVLLIQSFTALYCLNRSCLVFFTNSLRDFINDINKLPLTLKIIALRHGKSVKCVRFARVGHKLSETEAVERRLETKLLQCAISTSDFISNIQEECLKIGREKHIVTGYPRNDVLVNPTIEMKMRWSEYLETIKPQKVVLYGPSWRHGRVPTRFFPFEDYSSDDLLSFLEQKKILILLRPHVNDLQQYPELRDSLNNLDKSSKWVRFASHDAFPDVNTILPFVDVLISDYSALYHDFLLLNKPLMFIPYDFNDFSDQNGFLYDYFEYLPGPSINSMEQFCDHLSSLSQGEDPYLTKRNVLRDKIHTYQDANSCERVANLIDKICGAR